MDKQQPLRGVQVLSEEQIDVVCQLKKQVPERSLERIIQIAEQTELIQRGILKRSTVHRVLQSNVTVQVGCAILITSGSRGDFLDHFDHLAEGIDRKEKMCCNEKNAGRGDTYCGAGARAGGQGRATRTATRTARATARAASAATRTNRAAQGVGIPAKGTAWAQLKQLEPTSI